VPAPRRIAAVAVCLVVALAPGAAVAQNGAGDDQYADPFSDQSQPAPKPKRKPTSKTPVQPVPHQQLPSQEPEPEQEQPQTSTAPAPQAAATARSGELPRTGLNLVPLALGGVALVVAGLVLRRAGHGRH
jgi:outer membrane biosynthesis protein TonB